MARCPVSVPLILVLSAALVCFPQPLAQAQAVNNATQAGYPPYGTFSGSNFDQVSYQNGNLHISIPIQNIPQRNGKTYSHNFVYNLPSWVEFGSFNPNTGKWTWTVNLNSPSPLNWILASNVNGWGVTYLNGAVTCGTANYGVVYDITAIDPEGTQHPVLMQLTDGAPQSCAQSIPAGLTSDGSGILVTGTWTPPTPPTPTFTVTLNDGTKLPLYSTPNWEDNNGNEMSATADMINPSLNPLTVYNAPNTGYTTPLGQHATGPAYTTWSYTDSNGASQSFTLNYEAIDIDTSFTPIPGGTVSQYKCACVVPYTLTLPGNGGVYTFGWKNNDAGELASVALPTGGSISYTYKAGPITVTQPANLKTCGEGLGGCDETELVRDEVTSRAVTDNSGTHTWNYAWSGGTAGGGTVTDPLGNQEVHTYNVIPVNPNNPDCPTLCSGTSYETEVQYETSSGTVLRTVTKTYAADTIGVIGGGAGNNWGGVGNVRLTSETTTLNDVTPNLVKQVNTAYEIISNNYIAPGTSYNATWLNPASVSESDWGSGSAGSVLRYTTYTYLHDPTNNPSGYTNYLSRNIANKVLAKSVYDSTSSTCQGVSQPCAQTVNEYDNYTRTNQRMQASNTVQHDNTNYSTTFIYRGNVTAVSRWLNTTGSYFTTTNQYDDAGEMLSTIDPLTNETTFGYSDSWTNATCAPSGEAGAYLTKMTNALNQVTSYTYDSCTGLKATVTDPNTQVTTTTYDLLGRVTNVSYPDQGSTSYCYTDTGTGGPSCTQAPLPHEVITTTAINSSTPNEVTTTVLDDLGRTSQTQLNSDTTTTYTLATYDADGRTSQVYNPTRCSPITTNCGESTWGYTTTGYDPLSRVTSVQEQDTSTVNTSYSGNCTTVTDEVGNARKSCSDGLGRITGVWEDPGSSPHLNYETDYTYNALDDLLSVTQKGSNSSNARTRTFQYNSLSELTSATNPESGTITYTYDGDGNVSTKTAPLPNQTGTSTVTTTYSYDKLNRLTGKSYKDGSSSDPYTSTVIFGYDDIPATGCTPPALTDPNPIGRRTAMCDGSGATSWSHDPTGRVKQEMRTIGSASNKNTYYNYNLDGSLSTLQSSPMNTISYAYSGAARATSAVDSGDNINFATGATYAPPGELAGMTLGSATSFSGFSVSNAYNPRLQPFQLYAQISSTHIVFSECHDFHLGVGLTTTYNGTTICSVSASTLGDNGNLYQTVNNLNNTRTQSFTYDSLNRIVSGQSSGTQWGETFTIDAWGNLTNRAPIAGKTNYEPLNAAPATVQNQLNGFCYDAAGNLALNGSCPQPPITPTTYYDAENRLVWTAGYRYIYDGDGQRVEKCQATSATTACPTSGTTGTLYWRGTSSDTLYESDLGGNPQEEYIFFNDARIARSDLSSSGAITAVHYYFSDHLGSHSVIENATGTSCEQDIDYYPYGGEENDYCSTPVAQHYKFTGKERDSESGLDNFGARYDASSLGRFMSPDSLGGHRVDPQTLNKYAYVRNSPLSLTDPTGLDFNLTCSGSDTATCNGGLQGTTTTTTDANGNQTSTFTATVISNDNGNLVDQNGNQYNATVSGAGVSFSQAGSTQPGSMGVFINGSNSTTIQGTGGLSGFTFNFTYSNSAGNVTAGGTFTYNGNFAQAESALEHAGFQHYASDDYDIFHPSSFSYHAYDLRSPGEIGTGAHSGHFTVDEPWVSFPPNGSFGHGDMHFGEHNNSTPGGFWPHTGEVVRTLIDMVHVPIL